MESGFLFWPIVNVCDWPFTTSSMSTMWFSFYHFGVNMKRKKNSNCGVYDVFIDALRTKNNNF